jgi:hypothetical protein
MSKKIKTEAELYKEWLKEDCNNIDFEEFINDFIKKGGKIK